MSRNRLPLASATVLLTLGVAPALAAPVFAPAVDRSLDGFPSRPLLADLTGDGRPDLVLQRDRDSAGDPDSVFTLVNDGKGGFAPATTHAVPGTVVDFEAADVDKDGDVDVIASLSADPSAGDAGGQVVLLRGDGTGALSAAQPLFSTGPNAGLVAADLDGDGWPDLAAATSTPATGTVLAYRNTGGAFALHASVPASMVSSVAAGDVDLDGDADLLLKYGTGSVRTMRNAGDGTFAAPADNPATTGLGEEAVVADLSGDGRPDVAATAFSNLPGVVRVALGQADGTLGVPTSYGPLGYGAGFPLAADFDGDGDADLAFSNRKGSPLGTTHTMSLLLNQGAGSFAPAIDYDVHHSGPQATADLDGNGTQDVVQLPYVPARRAVSVLRQMSSASDVYGGALQSVGQTVTAGATTVSIPLRVPRAGLRGTVGLQDLSGTEGASAAATTSRIIGSRRVNLRRGRPRVRVTMSTAARRTLRAKRRLRVAVLVRIERSGRATRTRRAVVTLRAAPR